MRAIVWIDVEDMGATRVQVEVKREAIVSDENGLAQLAADAVAQTVAALEATSVDERS